MPWMVKWASPFPPYVESAAGAHFRCVDGHDYVFGITGFQVGAVNFASFSSPEGQTNGAELRASFNDAGTFAVPGPIAGDGLPGIVAALGGLIGLAKRRRRNLVG